MFVSYDRELVHLILRSHIQKNNGAHYQLGLGVNESVAF